MNDYYYLPRHLKQSAKVMVFVDGENLAIRYASMLKDKAPEDHVVFEPNVFVWTPFANVQHHVNCEIVRRYYYTSVQGDDTRQDEIEEKLKAIGIEAPCVFKKAKGKRSKRVDISLATDMLTHAYRKNCNLAILVAGDEDYMPLVEAVMAEGRRVVLWFLEDGLSQVLKRKVDHYFNIGTFLFNRKR